MSVLVPYWSSVGDAAHDGAAIAAGTYGAIADDLRHVATDMGAELSQADGAVADSVQHGYGERNRAEPVTGLGPVCAHDWRADPLRLMVYEGEPHRLLACRTPGCFALAVVPHDGREPVPLHSDVAAWPPCPTLRPLALVSSPFAGARD